MGCHTWFYKKSNLTFEQAKEIAIKEVETAIGNAKQMLKNDCEEYVELRNMYEWDDAYIQNWIKDLEKDVQLIHENDKEIVYTWVAGSNGFYDKTNETLYENSGYHDIIRVLNYPTIHFYTFEQMLDWIIKHRFDSEYNTSHITNDEINKLRNYWQQYPNSIVHFG